MATTFSVGIVGAQELQEVMAELVRDFGPKDSKGILVGAVRQAMRPALETAKANAPVDTGALKNTLWVEARKPTNKDRKSKYIQPNDVAIAAVTTKAFPKKIKKNFYKENSDLYAKDKKAYKAKFRKFVEASGSYYDGRAIAAEFGTANVAAQPFLRSALESNSNVIVNDLSGQIRSSIERYKAKQARKANKG